MSCPACDCPSCQSDRRIDDLRDRVGDRLFTRHVARLCELVTEATLAHAVITIEQAYAMAVDETVERGSDVTK